MYNIFPDTGYVEVGGDFETTPGKYAYFIDQTRYSKTKRRKSTTTPIIATLVLSLNIILAKPMIKSIFYAICNMW